MIDVGGLKDNNDHQRMLILTKVETEPFNNSPYNLQIDNYRQVIA